MATAKKLPSGNWRVLASKTIDGQVVRKSFTSEDKKTAELEAIKWHNAQRTSKGTPKITLEDAINGYIDAHSNIYSPSTVEGYKKIQRNYFLKQQKMQISDITENVLQKEVNTMAARLSPKTIISALNFVCTVLSYYGVELNRKNIKTPQKQKMQYNTPSPQVLKDMLSVVKDTEIELPILLAALLGMRMSEILGLKWNCINDDYVTIKAARLYTSNGLVYRENTKTANSTRQVIIPQRIKDVLAHTERNGEFVINLTSRQITKRFNRLCEQNNIPHCRFHDLRHANASMMLAVGVPDKYAMERGGWSSTETLQKIYQQTFSEEQIKIAQILDNFYAKNL